jgi:predicted metal-dependent hydrolase
MNLEPIIRNKPVIPNKKIIQQDNSPLLTEIREKPITNYQPKSVISEILLKSQEKHSLNITNQRKEISEQLPPITNESQKENILLAKIRKLETENNNLKLLVQSEKQNNQLLKENITNLTHQIHADKQNHTNLINAYQKALNDKARAEQQVNYYEVQLKTIAKSLYQ